MINDSAYYESDEQKFEISDSSEQIEASKEPITDTHIGDRFRNLSVGIVSVKPAAVRVEIISWGITKGVIIGGTSIVKNVVTDVLTDSSKIIFKTDKFPLNPFNSQTLVIAS